MTPAVSIRGASVRFGETVAVNDVSLDVPERSTFGIVGESGSGKTTLMRAVLGLQHLEAGEIRIFGQAMQFGRRGTLARAKVIQPIFQDPAASLSPRCRIGTLMSEVASLRGEDRDVARERLQKIFGRLGIRESVLSRYPHEISGGQARRVAIARILLMGPKIIIADEPTAGLDVSVQGDLLNLLQDLRQLNGITLVVISHNLAVVRMIADAVAVMQGGNLVECGPASQVFTAPTAPYTRRLLASWPSIDN